ncbi:hypothetical protein LSH36_44g03000 [Paralvinella palmiformis]|uniref:SOCS box domain-containing protein n=1 Tax=Paralvinella palmiformis TaxID=53620 RepID=A0AAD9K6Q3_9ANNE|nr:hypothetical protein LSH36_44g03000 [Paralvinella palmiformis]
MATLDASIWLLIKERASLEVIHDKFKSIYRVDQQLDFFWLYLYYATQADHQPLVSSILDRTVDYIKTLDHVLTNEILATCVNEAIRKGNTYMIRMYLDRNRDVCTTEGSFYVADSRFKLTYAPVGLAVYLDAVDILMVIMEYYRGELIGPEQQTPLHLACKWPASNCLQYLLTNETALAGINQADADGWTPLLYAGMYHPNAIPALMERGADVSANDSKQGNVLQILSNWCIRIRRLRYSTDDPCPTLGKRRMRANASNEVIFIPDNFATLAATLVEHGVDVNADSAPLVNFAVNVHRRLAEIRGSSNVRGVFKEAMDYLAAVSNQDVRDKTLLKLCHIVNFIATQLRRCSDYDNMVGYIDLLSFTKDLFQILLVRGANADTKEPFEAGEKKIRTFQCLLPFSHRCCCSLKRLVAEEFADRWRSTNYTSTVDIVLIAIIGMYSLQIEEPELYGQAMETMSDIMTLIGESGAECQQPLHFFACLSIDPKVSVPILHRYLRCHGQKHYHGLLSTMQRYVVVLPEEEAEHFTEIRSEITACQNRLYTLKQLLRRDIVAYVGGWQHADKINILPLPDYLKSYLVGVNDD